MVIKIWGIFPVKRKQFIIIETVLFSFFFLLTVFFFSWSVPEYVDDPAVLFHAKYLKYVTLILSFAVVAETQYYLNKFVSRQLEINKKQKKKIEEQNEEIMQSIRYASRIQKAVLPSKDKLPENIDLFIFYKPKDVVSGDFYWFAEHFKKIVFVAGDCTGHGVPGAFMSILGISSLNDIINETEKELKSNEILNILRDKVVTTLSQDKKDAISLSGIDLSLIIIDLDKREIQFSGANNPLFLVRNKNTGDIPSGNYTETKYGDYVLYHFKPDRMHIGLNTSFSSFSRQIIKIADGDMLYMFSDGFVDQPGGKLGKKLMNKRFKNMLLNIADKNTQSQKETVNKFLKKWQGNYEQIDDIILTGIKINSKKLATS